MSGRRFIYNYLFASTLTYEQGRKTCMAHENSRKGFELTPNEVDQYMLIIGLALKSETTL